MVIDEMQFPGKARQLPAYGIGQLKLQLRPHRHRFLEQGVAVRDIAQPRLEQPIELDERTLVEGDHIEVAGPQTRLSQAECSSVARKARVVLAPGESLFLRRRDDLAIAHQCGGRIVIEGRDPENRRHSAKLTA